ncbi:MFS transporter [Bacillus manliponensis]|uniref:MFS transporter n=1 Tax=Bacillus manliponensis TaxID=574376 RepID=UPI003511FC4C
MWENSDARNLFLGRLISSTGDSVYQIAVIWYVYELTHNVFYTGLASAVTFFPKTVNFLFGPFIEFGNQKKLLVRAQFIQSLLLLIVPVAMLLGYENIWLVLFVISVVSFVENIQGTVEISIVTKVIDKEHLGTYNSFVSSGQQMIEIFMKGFFAFIIVYIGIGNIYLISSFAFLFATFCFMKVTYMPKQSILPQPFTWKTYKQELKSGFSYFFTNNIAIVCFPFLLSNFISGMTLAILPAYADEKMSQNDYGILVMAMTVGNLIGSILATKCMKYPLGKMMTILPFSSFILWLSSVFISGKVLTLVVFGLAFVPFGIMSILFITYLQTSLDQKLISRVVSIIDSVLVSTMPLGSLLAGIFTPIIGVKAMMIIGSCGLLCISGFFAFNRQLKNMQSVTNEQTG